MNGYLTRRLVTAGAVAIVGAGGYVAVATALGHPEVAGAFSALGIERWLLLLLLSVLNYGLRFLRWLRYIHRLGYRIPVGRHCAYYLAGFGLTVSPGKAGEAIRGVYLKDHGVPYSATLAALFSERVLDLLGVAALAALLVVGF
jgi:glycosyltransferase 2 family protein